MCWYNGDDERSSKGSKMYQNRMLNPLFATAIEMFQALAGQLGKRNRVLRDYEKGSSNKDSHLKSLQVVFEMDKNQEKHLENDQFKRFVGNIKSIRQLLKIPYQSFVSNEKKRIQLVENLQYALKMVIQAVKDRSKDKNKPDLHQLQTLALSNNSIYQKVEEIFNLLRKQFSEMGEKLQNTKSNLEADLSQKDSQIRQLLEYKNRCYEILKQLQFLQRSKQKAQQQTLQKQMNARRMEAQNNSYRQKLTHAYQQWKLEKQKNDEISIENQRLMNHISHLQGEIDQLKKKQQAQSQRQRQAPFKRQHELQPREVPVELAQQTHQSEENSRSGGREENPQKQLIKIKSQFQNLKEYTGKIESQLQTLRLETEQLKVNIIRLESTLSQAQQRQRQAQQRQRQAQQRYTKAQQRQSMLKRDSQTQLKTKTLFIGNILDHKKGKQKIFMMQSIEKHMKKFIENTELLYDTRRDYRVPFHERIDGRSNLVIVLETKNALLAGYYSGIYAQATHMAQEGLIISLTNLKSYCLNTLANNPKKNRRDTRPIYGMVYDRFFLIFGNSEIRVKPGDKERKVFSNFGVSNSYFNSEGDNVEKLLCEKASEVDVVNYQIYQVIFYEQI